MKKYIKKILGVALAGCMLASMGALVACGGGGGNGGDNNGGDGDNGDNQGGAGKEYVFEAEYTDLTGLRGMGPSGSPTGLGLIGENTEASNGFYVGSLGEQSPITFKITSDKAVTVSLKGIFGSNALAPITWTPAEFEIKVNDAAVTYNGFKTEQATSSVQNFKLRTIGDIQLKAGENTIVFTPKSNTYLNGTTSAPSIDCIKMTTDATLTWEPLEENLD